MLHEVPDSSGCPRPLRIFGREETANVQVEILEPEIDLYKTIGQSQVCISYPFTSPAIIARELAIPSVFYIDQKVMNENNHVHGVEFISEKFKLFNFIVQHCLGGQQ